MDSKKKSLKSPAILPPRKYPIQNQDSNIIIIQQDVNLPPHLSKGPTRHKPFIDYTHFSNHVESKHTYTTYNLRTDRKYYVDEINVDRDEDKDNEYKEDNS